LQSEPASSLMNYSAASGGEPTPERLDNYQNGFQMKTTLIRTRAKLPGHVLDLFWEYSKKKLSWQEDADLIIRKVLESGGWDSVKWLIATTGYAWLKSWMLERRGAGLDAKRLRFWQLTLSLPKDTVDAWIADNNSNPWQGRGIR